MRSIARTPPSATARRPLFAAHQSLRTRAGGAVAILYPAHKQDLQLRPIHHQLIERVEAHIFVAFLAIACTSRYVRGSSRWQPGSPRKPCWTSWQPSRCSTFTFRRPTAAPSFSAATPNSTPTRRSSSGSSTSNCPRSPRHALPQPAASPKRQPTPCSEDFFARPPVLRALTAPQPLQLGKSG